MLLDYALNQTSIILRVKIRQNTTGASPGQGMTGLTSASTGLSISTIADNEASPTAYTSAGSTIETITTLGTYAAPTATKCRFKEVSSSSNPGIYELQIADARFAVSSSKSLLVSITGVSGMADCDVCIPLRSVNPYDGVRGGMSALPNAAAAANGGLPTVDAANGVKVSIGTGTGQINASGGKVPATLASTDVTGNVASDVQTIKTQTVTCAAGVTVNPNVGTTQPVNFTGTAASALVKCDTIDINSVAASSVTTIGANIGTAQPIGFTGTGASALVKSDMVDIAGAAVNPNAAQLGVNVIQSAGTTIHNSDGTLASATATTVTFPTTDSSGNTIPDDARYEYTQLQIVAGTGIGQIVVLTTKSGVRTFNIKSGTCPVTLDATSQYIALPTWRSELELWLGSAPNALISGRVDSNTQATAASLSYNLTGNITGNLSGSVGSVTGAVGSVTGNVGGNVTGSVGSLATQAKTDVENATWNATLASHLTSGSTGAALNAAGSAGDPWATALPGAYGAGTAGNIVGNNLDATVSSRSTFAGGAVASVTGNVGGNVVGSVGSVTAGVTVTTNNDKTGYSLTQSFPANFAALAITVGGAVTAGTVSDKTGYALSSAGLDSVTIESGLNARQALSIIASASAGVLAGAATSTVTIAAAGVPATNRVTASVDSNGNRSAVTLNPPV